MSKRYVNLSEDETINNYFKELKYSKVLTPDEEVDLAIKIKEGDQKAINKLVTSNLKFVISIAKEYQGQGLTLGDLINEGNYGLIKATQKFDHTKGFRFISYAVWWIRQAIMQSLNENNRTIRLPTNVISKISKTKKEFERFEAKNHRPATKEDFHDDKEIMVIGNIASCSSLNKRINEDGSELSEMVESDLDLNKFFDNNKSIVKSEITNILSLLNDREKDVIESYYGIDKSHEGMTLEAIGEKYKLTKERVRQIKEKGLRKLRHNSYNLFDILND